MILQSTGKNHN
jgi:acetyl-CoA carboxylase/biotin carboxylase 1